ncbi:MAG: Asp23/Gls24 family envelope stress response protein [Candidatus Omnitrophica bacterium]|nr:Asp23/Gls24 family envelope stress response protein [Candidatus Omnitrophota bacterium]
MNRIDLFNSKQMIEEESRTDLGTISIHNNVISSLASIAAQEIEGVKEVSKHARIGFLELTGKKPSVIKVNVDQAGQVTLEIPLTVKYGYNIPDIANKVQENVRNALEKATNLSVKNINIIVCCIEKS